MKLSFIHIIGIFCIFTFSTSMKCKLDEKPSMAKYDLGVSIQPYMQSGLISYWLVCHEDGKISYRYPLSRKNFMLQMQGKQRSYGNPELENLFQKFNIDSCFWNFDNMTDEEVYNCIRIDDLWVLRYNRNPFCPEGCVPAPGMIELGWTSRKAQASDAQMGILKTYGINTFHDIVYGEQMMKLFQDITQSNWQNNYVSLK